MENSNLVLVLLNDLMFQVKIAEAAKRSGVKVAFLDSAANLLQVAASQQPQVIVLDLNFVNGAPLATIRALKAKEETRAIPLLGYVSHVQVDLRAAAAEAGCDLVVARSAFVQNLPEMLSKYAASATAAEDRL